MDWLLRIAGTLTLGLVAAGLVNIGLNRDRSDPEPLAANAPITAAEETTVASLAPRERSDAYYQAVLDRPVFEISRRPIAPKPEEPKSAPIKEIATIEPPAPAPELPDVRLLGVMSSGTQSRALISVDGGDPLWLSEGENLGGWTVNRTGEDWLELTAQDKTLRLDLFE